MKVSTIFEAFSELIGRRIPRQVVELCSFERKKGLGMWNIFRETATFAVKNIVKGGVSLWS